MNYNLEKTLQIQSQLYPDRPPVLLDTMLTIPNIPLLVIDNIMRDYKLIPNSLVRPILKSFGEDKIFVQKTVNETLWGYEDPALRKLSEMSLVKKYVEIDPTFGLLQGQNNSVTPGEILVDLGISDYKQANEILKINGQDKLHIWESDYANDIMGTDGQQMHPFVDRSENITTYCNDIFRSIWLYYVEDKMIHGVRTFKYDLPPEVFALPEVFPPNQGFCSKGVCPPGSGVIGVGVAEPMNAPVYVSLPHFLHADPYYMNALEGISAPNEETHGTYVYLEPVTGFVFGTAKRVQFNFLMKKSNLVPEMYKLPDETFLPVLWYEITVEADKYSAFKWKMTIGLIRFFYLYGYIGWLIFGTFILLTMAIRSVNRYALYKQDQILQQNLEDERLLIESSHVDLDNNRLRQICEINGFVSHSNTETENNTRRNVLVTQDLETTTDSERLPDYLQATQNSAGDAPMSLNPPEAGSQDEGLGNLSLPSQVELNQTQDDERLI